MGQSIHRSGYYAILILLLLHFSCGSDDVDCTNALPPPNWFELGFYTPQGDPFIGEVYQQSEFRVFSSSFETFVSAVPFGSPDRLRFFYDEFESNTDYYIEFSAQDTDTLRFVITSRQDPCFLIGELQQLSFNNENIEIGNSEIIDLIKDD